MIPTIAPPSLREFLLLSPSILLGLWGLIVLVVDLSILRKSPGPARARSLGSLSLLGVALAFGSMFAVGSSGVGTGQEELLFQGTLLGGPLIDRITELLLILLAMVIGLSMALDFTEYWGEYYALLLWSAVGMILLASSEELLTLFLTLELMTIALYLITAFEKNRKRSAEAGLKYFIYGSVSSALFLFGLSLIYGLTGSTRLETIGLLLRNGDQAAGLGNNVAGFVAVLLILVGFGFKIAAVPFHQWAPDVYEGAPAPVAAWIATGSKIASFIALLKVFVQALGPWASQPVELTSPGWISIIALIAALTMTYGNFAALGQKNLKRMLAYSSIAHSGYMLVGVLACVVAQDGKAAGTVLFYLFIYSFSNIGAFALAVWLVRDKGTDEINDLNGLAARWPILAVSILLLMLSLIGMPVLAGFWGKLYMFMEAINRSDKNNRLTFLWLVALGLMNSVVSAFYYVRVLRAMFLRAPSGEPLSNPPFAVRFSILVSTAIVLVFSVFPTPLVDESMKLADSRSFSIGGVKGFRSSVYAGPPIKDKLRLPAGPSLQLVPQPKATAK